MNWPIRLLTVMLFFSQLAVHAQESWQVIDTPTDHDLRSLHFVNDDLGFIGGDQVLLKTINGGATWVEVDVDSITTDSGSPWTLEGLHFFDEFHGFTVLGTWAGMHETFDGGQTWTQYYPASSGFCQAGALYFFDENNGFAGGGGCFEGYIIDRLTDGTWYSSDSPNGLNTENIVRCIEFNDAQNGLAGTERGTILRTTDGGQNWEDIPNPLFQTPVTDFAYHTADTVRASYAQEGGFGILISFDGGASWDTDGDAATFYYPHMHAAHVDGLGRTFIGGETYDDMGVIFNKLNPWWDLQTVDRAIYDIDSHSDSIVFLVGDSGMVFVNTNPETLGVDELGDDVGIVVWPNPVVDVVEVRSTKQGCSIESVVVTDLTGRIVREKKSPGVETTNLDLGLLKRGGYLVRVRTADGALTKEILKQ